MILEAIIGAIIVSCVFLYIFSAMGLALKIGDKYGAKFYYIAASIEIGITIGFMILIGGILCK